MNTLRKYKKLSDILSIAVDDYEKVLKDDRYVINMDMWHNILLNKCHVCLAGCFMAKTLKEPINKYVHAQSYGAKTAHILNSINKFRLGEFNEMFLNNEFFSASDDTYKKLREDSLSFYRKPLWDEENPNPKAMRKYIKKLVSYGV